MPASGSCYGAIVTAIEERFEPSRSDYRRRTPPSGVAAVVGHRNRASDPWTTLVLSGRLMTGCASECQYPFRQPMEAVAGD